MENRNRRVRLVVKLQAAARGFLLRARLRALRGDYERVVSEVQGGLAGLSWVEGLVARPQFCSGDADPAAPHAPGDAPERDATRLPRGYKGEHADPELGEGAQGTAPQAQGSPLLTQRGPEEAAGTRDPGRPGMVLPLGWRGSLFSRNLHQWRSTCWRSPPRWRSPLPWRICKNFDPAWPWSYYGCSKQLPAARTT
uniref:IQ domain-containing protein C isoform X3 n=1 Tax=Petromyzon marinus TaxID=7757 RepID=A0AAJ7TBZ9_PETMA|nr:IQ domain-containing protein C isoform X3 [Petromyzon marinus]